MDKFKEIRPIVLGIAKNNNRLLVSKGYDSVKDNTFYRCLGGGIEFFETSQEALVREFKEELDIEIEVGKFHGITESLFSFEGKRGHEIVFFYDIKIKDTDYKEIYPMIDDNREDIAIWVDIDDFKNEKKILYPEDILKYL